MVIDYMGSHPNLSNNTSCKNDPQSTRWTTRLL